MADLQYDNEKHANITSSSYKRKLILVIAAFLIGVASIIIICPIIIDKLEENAESARAIKTQAYIHLLINALERFKADTGILPSNSEGLKALVEKPENAVNWNVNGYLNSNVLPKDAWGNEFIYHYTPQNLRQFVIYSFGADGKKGGEGNNKDLGIVD
ncbi:MAG: type II secretion system protein GspG [Planctomycetes bacterium]|nr:type II secretion system protein GspG [Planctomycetota bacterium]